MDSSCSFSTSRTTPSFEKTRTARSRPSAGATTRRQSVELALKGERELSFYGDIDFIPTEEYSEDVARTFAAEATFVVQRATALMEKQG